MDAQPILRSAPHHEAEQLDPNRDLVAPAVWVEMEIEPRLVDGQWEKQYTYWLAGAPGLHPRLEAIRTGS